MSSTTTTPSAAKVLAAILRASNDVRPVWIAGAGTSFRSGVPLAAEAVRRIAKAAYIRHELGGRANPAQVKYSQWATWLAGHEWFIRGEDRLAENFPLMIEHLLRPDEFRREVLLDLMEPVHGVSSGYHQLADFMLRGLVWTVLTTNFDPCLPRAFQTKQPHLKRVAEVNRGRDDFAEFSVYERRQLVWLHGRAEQYTDRNLLEEVQHLDAGLVSRLRPLVDDSPLIVVGYRGAEPSVMDDLLFAGVESSQHYRKGIYWCLRRGETLHPNVERLQRAIGRNFHLLEVDGFDELMGELTVELKGEDLYASAHASAASEQAPQTFDERPVAGVSLDDCDLELMLSVLGTYCETVGRAAVSRETLVSLLRELGLVRAGPNGDAPTIACCLLFAREIPSVLRHAAVAVTRGGKGRTIVRGNLITQLRELVALLDSQEFNPLVKVKGKRTYEERQVYPSRTLTELIVNLLVHRDYENEELAEIDLDAGRAVRFNNPGTVLEEIRDRLDIDEAGRFRPVRTLSGLRNPSIADVFFGMRSMERVGSGLADAEDDMRRAGGEAVFSTDLRQRFFRAALFQPLQAAPGVARPITPLGLYVLNSLPISVLPDHISVGHLKPGSAAQLFQSDLSDVPTFVLTGEEVWSFAPSPVLALKLAPWLSGDVRPVDRARIESDPEQRRFLTWLLRKHWEMYLRRFRKQGLFIENKKHRAFFCKGLGKPVIEYDSPKRRGIKREVVKARAEGRWHENEGIGYQVIYTDGRWVIRVKPFYMFTRRDGVTPLPGFERTRRATRRMKFDRNKNVDDDLTFWGRFLSQGQPVISMGGTDVENLVLDAGFLTVEVPEIGLLDEPDADRAER